MSESSSSSVISLRERHERFLDTSTEEALLRWDELLRLQVDFFAEAEMDFLADFSLWRGASDILDVGCGNGRYISALHSRFSDKSYTGIDISEGLIAQARELDTTVDFYVGDFLDFEIGRRFDLIVMRFVVQHLTDFSAVLDGCSRLLAPGGVVLIIEPDLAGSRNHPPTPHFNHLLAGFERRRDDDSRIKTRINNPRGLLRGVRGWRLAAERTIPITNAGPSAQAIAENLYLGWVDMIDKSGLMACDLEETYRELYSWASIPDAVSQINLRVVGLRFSNEGQVKFDSVR